MGWANTTKPTVYDVWSRGRRETYYVWMFTAFLISTRSSVNNLFYSYDLSLTYATWTFCTPGHFVQMRYNFDRTEVLIDLLTLKYHRINILRLQRSQRLFEDKLLSLDSYSRNVQLTASLWGIT